MTNMIKVVVVCRVSRKKKSRSKPKINQMQPERAGGQVFTTVAAFVFVTHESLGRI